MTLTYIIPILVVGVVVVLALAARSQTLSNKTWVKGRRPEPAGANKADGSDPSMEDVLAAVRVEIASKS